MLHLLAQPLVADIGEVIGALVGLIALVLWVIQKVSEANKVVRPRQAPPQEAEAPVAGQENARAAGQQADPLRAQVEEFLRRAGEAKRQPGEQQAAARHAEQPIRELDVFLDDAPATMERRPVSAPMPSAERQRTAPANVPSRSSDVRPPRRSVIPRKRKSLAERATEREEARKVSIAQQAANLGQRIITEDQQFDVQLKAKFAHTVGTLAGTAVSNAELSTAPPDTPAAQIAAMLATPDGVRQAIVVNEILRRPTDRW